MRGPFCDASRVLNNLHPFMGKTPLVMFYPGNYDDQFPSAVCKIRDKKARQLLSGLPADSIGATAMQVKELFK